MYIQEIEEYRGTGAVNALGETLEEFLENYNPTQYPAPFNTTDILVFKTPDRLTHWGQPLKVLLIKRKNHPCIGWWAAPGGFVDLYEDLEIGAARELEEETGIKGLPLVQLKTWGNVKRDPRWRVITTAYLSVIEGELNATAGDDAEEADWFNVELLERKQEISNIMDNEQISGCCDAMNACSPSAASDIMDYELTLTNERTGEAVGATIRVSTSRHALLSQVDYRIIESNKIASDHASLILDALLYIKSRISG